MRSNRINRMCVLLAVASTSAALCGTVSASSIFGDNFNRSNSSTIGNGWTKTNTGGGDVEIAGNTLNIYSNSGFDTGSSFVTQPMSNFGAGWNNVLGSNTGLVTWSANMRSNNSDLDGFSSGNEGIAFVLAANGSDLNTASGYAVVWGESGTTDSLRLVRFSGGLDSNSNLTDLITANSGIAQDVSTNYMSVKVTYSPTTNTFTLYARSDSPSFVDAGSGAFTNYGSFANTTFTSTPMSHIGLLGRYDGNGDSLLFDNINVDLSPVPEPTTLLTSTIAGLTMLSRPRRRVRVAPSAGR